MSQVSDHDVEAIRQWLAKEPHLPKTFGDIVLKKFLYSCDFSIEKTKKCIEEFCTRRANMPEIYTNRDPLSKGIQNVFNTTTVTTYICGPDELLIHQLKEVNSDFDFYDNLKAFTMQADNWIRHEYDVLPENHLIVIDIKLYTIRLAAKVNIFYLQKFLSFLLESMPIRLKHVHLINCPSFYEYLFNLVRPALPDYLCNMIHFHPDHTGLYNFIKKEYLPKDYGGDAEGMSDQNAFWVKRLCDNRKVFADDSYWRADLGQKTKKTSEQPMNGSFKAIEID